MKSGLHDLESEADARFEAEGWRQALVNGKHCLVSSRLGQAVKLERGSPCVSHPVGSGIQFGGDGGELGA